MQKVYIFLPKYLHNSFIYSTFAADFDILLRQKPANNEQIVTLKLKNVLFPASVLVAAKVANSDELKHRSIKESIPEFIRFNIVESEVRNVI